MITLTNFFKPSITFTAYSQISAVAANHTPEAEVQLLFQKLIRFITLDFVGKGKEFASGFALFHMSLNRDNEETRSRNKN